jgi:hypothetical protein
LFDEADIPWSELAFNTVRRTLECFFRDRRHQDFQVRTDCLSVTPPLKTL